MARVLACVGGLRPWPRWFVRALPWRLLSGRFCRAFPVAWRSVSGGLRVPVRSVWPAGSVRSGVSLLSSDGRFAGGLSVSCPRRCSLQSVLGVAGLRQLLGRRLATSAGVFWGGLVHRRLRFHPPSPSVFLVVAGLVDGGLASLLRFRSGVLTHSFAVTVARLLNTRRAPTSSHLERQSGRHISSACSTGLKFLAAFPWSSNSSEDFLPVTSGRPFSHSLHPYFAVTRRKELDYEHHSRNPNHSE